MKTALTELIEDLQDMCPDYYNNNYNWLHNLLEKEKQQIIDAYDLGMGHYGDANCRAEAEKYYNEIYKK